MDYKAKWDAAISFKDLTELFEAVVSEGKTTGLDQSQELKDFSKLNVHRMRRIRKTYEPNLNGIREMGLNDKVVFLTITESWCGDAAQAMPVMAKIADELGIEHRYILRDENPDLMDEHLSDGARSIPILLILDKSSFKVLGQWGSRPKAADQIMANWKLLPEPKISKEEVKTQIQVWYNKDKQQTIQGEIVEVLNQV